MASDLIITDMTLTGFLIVLGMVIVYLIIREFRIMKTTNRSLELGLEKDKLALLQQHEAKKTFPFTRLSPEQVGDIRKVQEENASLETGIYAKEKLLEARLARLENIVREKKLDNLLASAGEQEKKVK